MDERPQDMDLYHIGKTAEELQQALITLRADFDSHNHDGSSSKTFETLQVQTLVAQTFLIKKTSYASTTAGIWMGFVAGVFSLNIGDATSNLKWNGSTLAITGSITATAGTIGGFSIGATTLSGGSGLVLSSAGTGTITGGVIQTAASGKRVVLTGSDGTLRFYDSAGQVIGLGTDGSGYAFRADLNATTNNGLLLATSVAGNGYYYTNTANVRNRGIYVEQTNTGSSNDYPGIEISYAGINYAELITSSNTAGGIAVYMSGTGIGVYCTHSGTGYAMNALSTSTGGGIYAETTHATSGNNALYLVSATSSNNGAALFIDKNNSGVAIDIDMDANNGNNTVGLRMNVVNAGAGTEYAFELGGDEYLGTKTSVSGFTGVIRILTAADGPGYIPVYDTAS